MCWHGFQYVRVTPGGDTGFTGALDAIVGLEIHTNVSEVSSLTFGGEGDPAAEDAAEVLAHINQMTLQSQRSNVAAYIPTDCKSLVTSLQPQLRFTLRYHHLNYSNNLFTVPTIT